MFSNYLKLAIKVLGRRTFFTVISLFGISFTLMILILLSAYMDAELGSHQPLSQKDDMIFLNRLMMTNEVIDTSYQIDTVMLDGIEVYDSTEILDENRNSVSISSLGYYFCDNYLRDVAGADLYSFYSPSFSYDIFVNGNKLAFDVVYSDADFWSIYDYQFSSGRPFRQQEVDNQSQVVVLTEKAAQDYFGSLETAMGEFVEIDGKQFEVIGLVKRPSNSKSFLSGQAFMPLTTLKSVYLDDDQSFQGPFEAVFLASSSTGMKDIEQSILQKSKQIALPDPENYNHLYLITSDFFGRYANSIFPNGDNDPEKSKRTFILIGGGLLLLFILLPTLNLINLNVSRIMERSAEIGVRKAFGAHSGSILTQLLFENIVLTFLGGAIGFVLAFIVLHLVNDSNILGDTLLRVNYRVFGYSLLICLAFGIISGLLPAYRMSKIHIANAIKQTNV